VDIGSRKVNIGFRSGLRVREWIRDPKLDAGSGVDAGSRGLDIGSRCNEILVLSIDEEDASYDKNQQGRKQRDVKRSLCRWYG
jgi:hypothetical protein